MCARGTCSLVCCCYSFPRALPSNTSHPTGLPFGPLRYKIYRMTEKPHSSVYAKMFAVLSMSFIAISVSGKLNFALFRILLFSAGLIMGSMCSFQKEGCPEPLPLNTSTACCRRCCRQNSLVENVNVQHFYEDDLYEMASASKEQKGEPRPLDWLVYLEYGCVTW